MSQQEPIILFPGVEIMPNLDMQHTILYLKRYCSIDELGDTLYVKKIGNDQTTYAIEFSLNEISKVRKIKDETGNNVDDAPIFDNNNHNFESNDDGIDYDDI